MRSKWAVAFAFAIIGISSLAYSQSPTSTAQSVPVFRAESRLVLVDVVVRGNDGKAVKGLNASDFRVLENGKAQKLVSFEERGPASVAISQTPPQLPPHQFSNVSLIPKAGALDLVLLDMLNTPAQGAVTAREQVLRALKTLPQGHQVALFVLSRQGTRLLQGLTSDPELLSKAARELKIDPTDASSEAEIQRGEEYLGMVLKGMGRMVGRSAVQAMKYDETSDQRVRATFAALKAIARWTAGFPGRKNLVWLTSGLPLILGPEIHENDVFKHEYYHDIQGPAHYSRIRSWPFIQLM